jgi:hypothetical protein
MSESSQPPEISDHVHKLLDSIVPETLSDEQRKELASEIASRVAHDTFMNVPDWFDGMSSKPDKNPEKRKWPCARDRQEVYYNGLAIKNADCVQRLKDCVKVIESINRLVTNTVIQPKNMGRLFVQLRGPPQSDYEDALDWSDDDEKLIFDEQHRLGVSNLADLFAKFAKPKRRHDDFFDELYRVCGYLQHVESRALGLDSKSMEEKILAVMACFTTTESARQAMSNLSRDRLGFLPNAVQWIGWNRV